MLALLDANVLFSIVLTDVLLSAADEGIFVPLWTERILDEAERGITERWARRGRLDPPPLRARFVRMREAFTDAMIEPYEYEDLIPRMLNDEKDRHVLAAAVAYRVDAVVTGNVRHFPHHALAGQPVGEIATPDAFLCKLHRADPSRLGFAIDRLLARKRRPAMTLDDLLGRLEASGASAFANRLGAATHGRGPG